MTLSISEISEGNKLIAEFMKYEKVDDDINSCFYKIDVINLYTFNPSIHHEEQLCFEQSWDWLTPVVKKIIEIPNISMVKLSDILYEYNKFNIEGTWLDVVKFIKDHNSINS